MKTAVQPLAFVAAYLLSVAATCVYLTCAFPAALLFTKHRPGPFSVLWLYVGCAIGEALTWPVYKLYQAGFRLPDLAYRRIE